MRTTVTLDPQTERLLRKAIAARGVSFKVALNDAVLAGLAEFRDDQSRFVVDPSPLGLRPSIDPARLNSLADDLEADAFGDLASQ